MKLLLPKSKVEKTNPTDYIFILDLSGSMWGQIDALKDTLRASKSLIKKGDTISIGWFSSFGEYGWVIKGADIQNKDIEPMIDRNIYARGLTCYTQILGDLDSVVKDVQSFSGNKIVSVYFLSDGQPNDRSPISQVNSICSNLKGSFTNVKIVGYGRYYDRNVLLEMASRIGGTMNHVSDFEALQKGCSDFIGKKVNLVNVKLDQKFDLVWQVSNDIMILSQNNDNSVDVMESDVPNVVYGMNYDEIENLQQSDLTEGRFVYSVAYVLSQKNKANLGVKILNNALDRSTAQMLRKAFTTEQKGIAENFLKDQAINFGDTVNTSESKILIKLSDFLNTLVDNKAKINLKKSKYRKITRTNKDLELVETKSTSEFVTIYDLVGNENRPNLSFRTVQDIEITKVNDPELQKRIKDYNKAHPKNKIEFPIAAKTYKTFTFVANGDFNYEKFVYEIDGKENEIRPDQEIEIFDGTDREYKLSEFVSNVKDLISEKAECSVLRFLIDSKGESRSSVDLRSEKYHVDAVDILKDIGLDNMMRYSKKEEYKRNEEASDYVTFLAIDAALKGASKISAKDVYEKLKKSDGKSSVAVDVCKPFFDKYAKYETTVKDKGKLVEILQNELKTKIATSRILAQQLASEKFQMSTTNAWFSDAEKADVIEHDGVVLKVKEEKEYL